MSNKTKDRGVTPWIAHADEQLEPGHDDHIREAIARGLADLEAGRVKPAAEVWRKLGIE